MSCGEATDAFESSYLTLLGQSRFYNVNPRDNTLTIRGADLSILLVFDAAPANPLLGSWIVESYAPTPNSQTIPLAGTELTAVFRLQKVAGSSGCNTYEGPYTTNGTLAAIGPLASTRKACPDDVMSQETAFLAALQGVGKVDYKGVRLNLTDLKGSILVRLVRPSALEPSPGPSGSATPTASPTPTATTAPSASATAKPTPSPTATAAPTATATAAPDRSRERWPERHAGADRGATGIDPPDRFVRPDPPAEPPPARRSSIPPTGSP